MIQSVADHVRKLPNGTLQMSDTFESLAARVNLLEHEARQNADDHGRTFTPYRAPEWKRCRKITPSLVANTGVPVNAMPNVPREYGAGAVVRRQGLSAEQTTTVLMRGDKLIYVEMDDNGERKTIWAPWSLFDLVTPAPG